MKQQYVGDIGDFGKMLILKHLAGLGFNLGVNWVLTENDIRADGKHRDYVDYPGRHCLCCCDPSLFKEIIPLARTQRNDRKISGLEQIIRSFRSGASFFSELFPSGPLRELSDQSAFEKLACAELVFFDPDNGIAPGIGRSAKHVYLSELKRYWCRGQSLLIYHHLNHSECHPRQIANLKSSLTSILGVNKVLPYRLCRGTARAYFLCIQPDHLERIQGNESIDSIRPLEMTKAQWAKMAKICDRVHDELRENR